jgi:hypothetical protein
MQVAEQAEFCFIPVMEEYMSSNVRKILRNRKVVKNAFVVYWRHYG